MQGFIDLIREKSVFLDVASELSAAYQFGVKTECPSLWLENLGQRIFPVGATTN